MEDNELLNGFDGLTEGELKRVLRAILVEYIGRQQPDDENEKQHVEMRIHVLKELCEGPAIIETGLRRRTARQVLERLVYERFPTEQRRVFGRALDDLLRRGHIDNNFEGSTISEIRITPKGLAWLEEQVGPCELKQSRVRAREGEWPLG